MHSDEEYLVRTLTAGAKGYLLKDSAESDLVTAVRTVAKGNRSSARPSARRSWKITSASYSRRA